MKTFRKRVLSLTLAASVFSSLIVSTATAVHGEQACYNLGNDMISASSSIPESSASELEFQILSNDDESFPISLNIDVDQNSIEYEKLSEPIYGFEYALNEEKLDFNVITSLKTEFNCFDEYDLKVMSSDYEAVLFNQTASNDCSMTIPDLEVGETYSFCIDLRNSSASSEYVGEFTILREINNSLTVDLFYQQASSLSDIMPATLPANETESNNTQSAADSLSNGIAMIGSISSTLSAADVDYFYYTTPATASGGVVSLDISLSVPAGQRLTMLVSCAQTSYSTTKVSSTGTGVHLRIENASLGSTYYIKISKYSGASGGNYYLTVNQAIKDAWYGQFYATIGSVDYWNPNGLDDLYFKSGSTSYPVFTETVNDTDWMKTSCGIVSAAMVLRNKGETVYGYDFRTNYTGDMMADPYTVMLANFELDGVGLDYSGDNPITSSCGHSPNDFYRYTVASAFGVTAYRTSYFDENGNRTDTCTSEDIKDYIDNYGYAIVYLSGSPSHFMVFSDYNNTGTTMADTFYVYDPAASSYSTGANVLLANTRSGYQTKNYSDVLSITALN